MMKRSVLKLGLVLPVLVLCISVLTTTALAQSVTQPLFIYGYVTVNGAATSGVSVSAGGSSTTTGSSGYYQLSPSVANGSSVTVTANYQGHQQSKSVTQNMQPRAEADFAITYAVPSATTTPTSPPSSGGNGGSGLGGGGIPATGSAGYASHDAPTPAANNTTSNTVTATIAPTVAPTVVPTIAPTATPTTAATSIPTATIVASQLSGLNDSFDWWIAALLGALAVIVGSLYYFIMRKH